MAKVVERVPFGRHPGRPKGTRIVREQVVVPVSEQAPKVSHRPAANEPLQVIEKRVAELSEPLYIPVSGEVRSGDYVKFHDRVTKILPHLTGVYQIKSINGQTVGLTNGDVCHKGHLQKMTRKDSSNG